MATLSCGTAGPASCLKFVRGERDPSDTAHSPTSRDGAAGLDLTILIHQEQSHTIQSQAKYTSIPQVSTAPRVNDGGSIESTRRHTLQSYLGVWIYKS